jgi:hypothetical protein
MDEELIGCKGLWDLKYIWLAKIDNLNSNRRIMKYDLDAENKPAERRNCCCRKGHGDIVPLNRNCYM